MGASLLLTAPGDTITFNGATYTVTAAVTDYTTYISIPISPTTQQPAGTYAFTIVAGGVTTPTFGLLLEDGSYLLVESGDYLVQEAQT